ncbi:DUF397 domain-containing protein [Saccharothrix variisporea]|uniref:Uncharacterized protein DUF397 n=1 Tax=Saccharothrix variisporea TaxID=543527 RepID=A0A495X2Q2_9PSEU|nr:DUF397 domain-containing protein [Saccharothrix variisporea]RKT67525.1 uncharacterized protein DUF397 [Saccharothrix variisporea]
MVVGGEHSALLWRKSTYSDNDDCVEVALHESGAFVRNTRNRTGESLAFSWSGWRGFLRLIGER